MTPIEPEGEDVPHIVPGHASPGFGLGQLTGTSSSFVDIINPSGSVGSTLVARGRLRSCLFCFA